MVGIVLAMVAPVYCKHLLQRLRDHSVTYCCWPCTGIDVIVRCSLSDMHCRSGSCLSRFSTSTNENLMSCQRKWKQHCCFLHMTAANGVKRSHIWPLHSLCRLLLTPCSGPVSGICATATTLWQQCYEAATPLIIIVASASRNTARLVEVSDKCCVDTFQQADQKQPIPCAVT